MKAIFLNHTQKYKEATREPSSGALTWENGTTIYFYQDAQSLRFKRDVVINSGLNSISVWHLGGNEWF